jgi:hypothetical protein
MTTTSENTWLDTLNQALITLRNLEIQTQGFANVGVKYAETYAETLEIMARMSKGLSDKCQHAILSNAISICTQAGYEVKSPQ